jgi:hypothetical protein
MLRTPQNLLVDRNLPDFEITIKWGTYSTPFSDTPMYTGKKTGWVLTDIDRYII